ncbi:2'-5' RNA ligase family protein [Solemya velesiana gill symbiont]|uniref:2'-5' RNA ligase family protein n=1 Tax=Solemya velesiana gill symbiont TaxID=1918948 RepID=UPI003CCC2143
MRKGLIRISQSLSGHGGRQLHPEELHITLVFLGMVDAEQYGCVIEAADRVAAQPFRFSVDSVGYWKRPRILWCGPSETPRKRFPWCRTCSRSSSGAGSSRRKGPTVPMSPSPERPVS